MLLQILGPSHAWLEIALYVIAVSAVLAWLAMLIMREWAQLKTPATKPIYTTPPTTAVDDNTMPVTTTATPESAGGFKWRKAAPYLALAATLFFFVVLRPAIHALLSAGTPVVAPDAMNVEGAQVVADQVAGGYVQFGTVVSKLVIMIAIYALFSFVPWLFQQLTHPGPTKWKKESYTDDFNVLPIMTKFEVDGRLGLNAAIRVLAAVLGACLIS